MSTAESLFLRALQSDALFDSTREMMVTALSGAPVSEDLRIWIPSNTDESRRLDFACRSVLILWNRRKAWAETHREHLDRLERALDNAGL